MVLLKLANLRKYIEETIPVELASNSPLRKQEKEEFIREIKKIINFLKSQKACVGGAFFKIGEYIYHFGLPIFLFNASIEAGIRPIPLKGIGVRGIARECWETFSNYANPEKFDIEKIDCNGDSREECQLLKEGKYLFGIFLLKGKEIKIFSDKEESDKIANFIFSDFFATTMINAFNLYLLLTRWVAEKQKGLN